MLRIYAVVSKIQLKLGNFVNTQCEVNHSS